MKLCNYCKLYTDYFSGNKCNYCKSKKLFRQEFWGESKLEKKTNLEPKLPGEDYESMIDQIKEK